MIRCRHDGFGRLRSRARPRRHQDERQLSSLRRLSQGGTRDDWQESGGDEEAKWREGYYTGGGDQHVEPMVRVGNTLLCMKHVEVGCLAIRGHGKEGLDAS